MGKLKGKVALITGGSGGIGKATAKRLAKEGAAIGLVDIKLEGTEDLIQWIKGQGSKAVAIKVDVTDLEDTYRMATEVIEQLGGVDILVNNAGITRDNLFLRMGEEEWDSVMGVNLKGVFNCTKSLLKHMMRKREGRIINISSVAGIIGNPGQANYAASKAGVLGLTKTLARELASRGITVNAVAPGYIETRMTKDLPDRRRQQLLDAVPLKRPGQPEDVANVIAFLASEDASYITGQVINIDGGMAIV